MRCLPAVALPAFLAVGCALPQPPVETPGTPEAPAPVVVMPQEPENAAFAELRSDVEALRLRIAHAEAALAELRSQRSEQARALEEANRQAARASARLRPLATRAAAASYIADVEVSMAKARLASGSGADREALARAQRVLDSTREPFERGDYAAAIDRANQAEEAVAMAQVHHRRGAGADAPLRLMKAVPMRVTMDSHLRNGPGRGSAVRSVLQEGTRLLANANSGAWLRVVTEDGRSGWVYGPLLAPR